jgi:hypothetical protein
MALQSSKGTLQSDQQIVKETVSRYLYELKEIDKATYVGDEPLIFLNPNLLARSKLTHDSLVLILCEHKKIIYIHFFYVFT